MLEKPQLAASKPEKPWRALPRYDEREWWRKQLGKPLDAAAPKAALHFTRSAGR